MQVLLIGKNSETHLRKRVVNTKRFIKGIQRGGDDYEVRDLMKLHSDNKQVCDHLEGLLQRKKSTLKGVELSKAIRIDESVIPFPSILLVVEDDEIVAIPSKEYQEDFDTLVNL